MDRICGSAWGPFLASNEVPTGVELVAGGGVICATVLEVTVLKAELRLSDLSTMELILYCLFALEVNESSVRAKEKINFLEITAWKD
jgi:hypothetical protein